MDLLGYARTSKRPLREIADQLGIDLSYLHHLKAGRRYPSAALVDRINDATGGMVTWKDWSAARRANPHPWRGEGSRDA
jgi:transcriptional regulator with XRE-family HTH domain